MHAFNRCFVGAALIAITASGCRIYNYDGPCDFDEDGDQECAYRRAGGVPDGGGGGASTVCETPIACHDNADCKTGNYCLGGRCRLIPPGAGTCNQSTQCARQQACVNGICSQACA